MPGACAKPSGRAADPGLNRLAATAPLWEKSRRFFREQRVPMTLSDILTSEVVVPEMQAGDRWQAIDELLGVLVKTGRIKPEHLPAITQVVKKRETTMSTGIGFGIGIPHATTELITDVVGAFGRSKTGINFDALDEQPVNLVMLFLVPQGQFQKHLHTLANIAKVLHDRALREQLLGAPGADELVQVIRTQKA
jgi:mannitol/fructose-specific phosphotransferase system IIA component (Ntr-type)